MTPLPGLHEILRAAAPPERPCVAGVAVLDAALDRRDAGVKRVEDRVPQPLPRQLREEPLGAKREVAFIHDAEVGVKWNVQSGWPFSHSRTSADLWDETLSRMTCTGVPESIPSAPLSATRSRGPRSPPVRLSPVLLAARNGGGRTISRFRKKWNTMFGTEH